MKIIPATYEQARKICLARYGSGGEDHLQDAFELMLKLEGQGRLVVGETTLGLVLHFVRLVARNPIKKQNWLINNYPEVSLETLPVSPRDPRAAGLAEARAELNQLESQYGKANLDVIKRQVLKVGGPVKGLKMKAWRLIRKIRSRLQGEALQ